MSTWFDAITCQRIRHFGTLKFNYFHRSHLLWCESNSVREEKKEKNQAIQSQSLDLGKNWNVWEKVNPMKNAPWENENRQWMRYERESAERIYLNLCSTYANANGDVDVDPTKKQLQLTKIQSKWDKNHIKEMQLINSIRRRSFFPYLALVQIDWYKKWSETHIGWN